ncbi:DUF6616 family protein [Kaistia sp. MMO-174]|uniref:DUF6616 family protein n=1 Tax=Kaistia sp. MMO-174 TaxID=3081256 RepID=UPI00301A34CC
MTHYLAELYSPKPAWIALDPADKQQFFEAIGAGMAALSELGIEALAFGETDATKLRPASQSFFAIWRLADEAALDALLDGIAASGWHAYFDTINAAGPATDLVRHMGRLAAATA